MARPGGDILQAEANQEGAALRIPQGHHRLLPHRSQHSRGSRCSGSGLPAINSAPTSPVADVARGQVAGQAGGSARPGPARLQPGCGSCGHRSVPAPLCASPVLPARGFSSAPAATLNPVSARRCRRCWRKRGGAVQPLPSPCFYFCASHGRCASRQWGHPGI